jgi:hypothetical protein
VLITAGLQGYTILTLSLLASEYTNLYAYVGNDPINWIDPSGLKKEFACVKKWQIGGLIIGGAVIGRYGTKSGIVGSICGLVAGTIAAEFNCPEEEIINPTEGRLYTPINVTFPY